MFIYNTTFFIEHSSLDRFLAWLRPIVETRLCSAGGDNPRLSRLVEVPGEGMPEGQPLGIALQVEFETIDAARIWGESSLRPVLVEFDSMFAPAAVSFSSLFETLPL